MDAFRGSLLNRLLRELPPGYRAGVEMTVANTIIAELTGDWSTLEGQQIAELLPTPYLMRPVD